MQTQVWVSIVSLVGVVLGGGLSFLGQASAQRRADRGDQRRLDNERGEARRGERLELLRQFIRFAQQAEAAAEARDDTPEWKTAAQDILDELWVCERMIHILFTSDLHELARDYVRALNHVLWQEPAEGRLWEYLRGPKVAFLDAARGELNR
jgi:hypothetical protein